MRPIDELIAKKMENRKKSIMENFRISEIIAADICPDCSGDLKESHFDLIMERKTCTNCGKRHHFCSMD